MATDLANAPAFAKDPAFTVSLPTDPTFLSNLAAAFGLTGQVMASVAAAAPAGWLLLDGSTVVNGQTLYPNLWAVIPAGMKSGANIVLPDARGRSLIGAGTGSGLTARALLAAVGVEGVTLSSAESGMPTHTPTVSSVGVQSADHFHNVNGNSDNGTPHAHQAPANAGTTGYVINGTGDLGTANITVGGAGYALNSVTGPHNTLHVHFININSQGISANHNHTVTMNAVGGVAASSAHNNMQPSLALNWMIRT